jgi:hypothetical protein
MENIILGQKFTRGEIIDVQQVGDYHILRYHPYGPEDRTAMSWSRNEEIPYWDVERYEVYRTGVMGYPEGIYRPTAVFDTLDAALVHAIAVKHDGINTRADYYFMRSIS